MSEAIFFLLGCIITALLIPTDWDPAIRLKMWVKKKFNETNQD